MAAQYGAHYISLMNLLLTEDEAAQLVTLLERARRE
jgi:hypothetical protein